MDEFIVVEEKAFLEMDEMRARKYAHECARREGNCAQVLYRRVDTIRLQQEPVFAWDSAAHPKDKQCPECGRVVPDAPGIGGEYPCKACGVPVLHDAAEAEPERCVAGEQTFKRYDSVEVSDDETNGWLPGKLDRVDEQDTELPYHVTGTGFSRWFSGNQIRYPSKSVSFPFPVKLDKDGYAEVRRPAPAPKPLAFTFGQPVWIGDTRARAVVLQVRRGRILVGFDNGCVQSFLPENVSDK